MRNARFVIVAVFALTLCSGVVAGMLVSRLPNTPVPGPITPPPAEPAKTAMEQALSLKPDQQQQMQKIWEHVRTTADDCYVQAQDLQREQWDALVKILSPEQKVEFNKQDSEFKKRFEELKKQREAAFNEAVKQTDGILDESQRKRFHDLIEKRVGRGFGETPSWLGPQKMMPGDETGSTTKSSH